MAHANQILLVHNIHYCTRNSLLTYDAHQELFPLLTKRSSLLQDQLSKSNNKTIFFFFKVKILKLHFKILYCTIENNVYRCQILYVLFHQHLYNYHNIPKINYSKNYIFYSYNLHIRVTSLK